MAPSDELEYLKHLVAQLNDKIRALEAKAKAVVPPTPAQQLRTILMGPPGAGSSLLLEELFSGEIHDVSQARERKPPGYATSSASATSQRVTCSASK